MNTPVSGGAGRGFLTRLSRRSQSGSATMIAPTILAVDDDATAREVIRDTLTRAGYQVQTVSSYQEWEEIWQSGHLPDLVILDVVLAERRGGYEILRAVRKQNDSLPVLMLSARNTASDAAFAHASGASAYVSKGDGEFAHPARGLVATVRRLLAA